MKNKANNKQIEWGGCTLVDGRWWPKNSRIFIDPTQKMTATWFGRDWPVCWLREAAKDAGIDAKGTKKELVARIVGEIRKGNRKAIRRFDRCA